MPMQRNKYPRNWDKISLAVRTEAGWKCEWCEAPHMKVIRRADDGSFEIVEWVRETNEDLVEFARMSWARLKFHGLTRVIITTAHLDRNQANNARENLAALCQRCHLRYDIHQHIANRRYGRNHAGPAQMKLI